MSWCEPWLTLSNGIQIDRVDEEYIQESGMNPDFVQGDNWLHDRMQNEHPRYIPDGHVFLAKSLWKIGADKVIKILSHELFEVAFELDGLAYDSAHDRANVIEDEVGRALHAT